MKRLIGGTVLVVGICLLSVVSTARAEMIDVSLTHPLMSESSGDAVTATQPAGQNGDYAESLAAAEWVNLDVLNDVDVLADMPIGEEVELMPAVPEPSSLLLAVLAFLGLLVYRLRRGPAA